jgi:phage antirepressor YoqD-like protein
MEVAKIGSQTATMSSLEIAQLTDKRHDNVRRTIESLADSGIITLPQVEEVSNDGPGPKTISAYLVSKRDSYIIVAQLSPEFTARLVDRWQELEEQAPAFKIPQTYAAALRLCAEQAEAIETQQAQLLIAAPKAAFVDAYVDSTGLKGFRQVAKLIGANEAQFREFLIDNKIMYRLGGEWVAYQNHIDAGRFSVKTGEANGHAFTQSKFTPKGVTWVAGEWGKHKVSADKDAEL